MRESQKNRIGLEDLAQRIESVSTWADVAVPEQQLRVLRELAAHAAHRLQVSEDRQPEVNSLTHCGIVALFTGASGTGKTAAAEALARDLHLELYRIDLTRVVSKNIGETEKNLSRIFTEAAASGAILFFDEADALFGKRSEVKDSHDRYANIEVSYFLQRLEEYRGLVILAAEPSREWVPALPPRIGFVVEFSLPDAD
jgi:SpoVK/Ycf46/Vps4 family AAA+-type ATPase